MESTKYVLLQGKLQDAGPVSLLRAEWQRDESRFLLIRYAWEGHPEEPWGLRLDLDKRVILDSLDDTKADASVKALIPDILSIVAAERSRGTFTIAPELDSANRPVVPQINAGQGAIPGRLNSFLQNVHAVQIVR